MMIKLYESKFIILLYFTCMFSISCKTKKVLTEVQHTKSKANTNSLKERYARKLNIAEREIKNEQLYQFIDSWMGTPHRMGGLSKNGVDCSAFTCILEREIYQKSLSRTAKQMAGQVKRKYEDNLQEGDLVFFDFGGRRFSHVGVYLSNNKFVHASLSKGVTISDLTDPWYSKYFSRAGRP